MTHVDALARPSFLDPARIRRSLVLALGVVAPWGLGIGLGDAASGSIASFGCYLLIVSFPSVPDSRPLATLGLAALVLGAFATLGAGVALGGVGFFCLAVLAALAQAVMELRGGPLRLPVALAALAFFLSVAQVPDDGWLLYGALFLAGAVWGSALAVLVLPRGPSQPVSLAIPDRAGARFVGAAVVASLLGGVAALLSPSPHPGWLPAAALRVLKPTRSETLSRMKRRGIGSLLGAAVGGLLLGFSGAAWLHALLVGVLVFAMLVIGAKRYGAWTFCLTAVALAFDLGPAADPVPMALDRVLLTAGGLLVAAAVFALLPGQATSSAASDGPDGASRHRAP